VIWLINVTKIIYIRVLLEIAHNNRPESYKKNIFHNNGLIS